MSHLFPGLTCPQKTEDHPAEEPAAHGSLTGRDLLSLCLESWPHTLTKGLLVRSLALLVPQLTFPLSPSRPHRHPQSWVWTGVAGLNVWGQVRRKRPIPQLPEGGFSDTWLLLLLFFFASSFLPHLNE